MALKIPKKKKPAPPPVPVPSPAVPKYVKPSRQAKAYAVPIPPPNTSLPTHAALVYQHTGYAEVIRVETLSIKADKRGRSQVLLRGGYVDCWRVAEALAYAGWQVETFACMEYEGDSQIRSEMQPTSRMRDVNWTRKFEKNPWYLLMKDRVVSTETGPVKAFVHAPPSNKLR